MNGGRVLWTVGAYFVGTFPSAYLVARGRGASGVMAAVRRGSSEGDAHVLIDAHIGKVWGAVAASLDVLKGLLYALFARFVGDLPPLWLGFVGVLLVVGHSFPFYARAFAGRGLSTASGVLLALLPLAMVVAGVIIVAGYFTHSTGPATTAGFALAPGVAAATGHPSALVTMAGGIFLVILLRRVVGVSEAARAVGWRRALARRLIYDADRKAAPRKEGPDQAFPA